MHQRCCSAVYYRVTMHKGEAMHIVCNVSQPFGPNHGGFLRFSKHPKMTVVSEKMKNRSTILNRKNS